MTRRRSASAATQHGDAAQHRAAHSTRGWSSSHATTEGCYHCLAAGVGCRSRSTLAISAGRRCERTITWIPWQKAAVAGSSTDEGAGGEFFLFLPAFNMQTACRAVTQVGGLDQLEDRSLRMREVPGSKPGLSILQLSVLQDLLVCKRAKRDKKTPPLSPPCSAIFFFF